LKQKLAGFFANWWTGFYAGVVSAFAVALLEMLRVIFFAEAKPPQGALSEYFILSLFGSFFAFIPLSILLGLGVAFLFGTVPLEDRLSKLKLWLFGSQKNTRTAGLVISILIVVFIMLRIHGIVTLKMFTGFRNQELAGRVLNLIEYVLLAFSALLVLILNRIITPLSTLLEKLTRPLPSWIFNLLWLVPASAFSLYLAYGIASDAFVGLEAEMRNVIYAGMAALLCLCILVPLLAILTRRARAFLSTGKVEKQIRLLRLLAVLSVFGLMFITSLLIPSSHGAIGYAVNDSPLIGRLLMMMPTYSDFDNDRYSSFANGRDPDGFDHWRSPVGPEIVGNGVDDNGILGDGEKPPVKADWPDVELPEELKNGDFNIVLLTFDALRADHLSCYGYKRKTSANIDRYAEKSVLFEQAYSVGTGTMISIPTVFTGKYVSELQCNNLQKGGIEHEIVASEDTVQEYLRSKDYYTIGLYNVGYMNIVNQGWDLWKIPKGKTATVKNDTSKETTEEGIELIEKNIDRKFFMWIHYYDPHDQYIAHKGQKSYGSSRTDLYDGEIYYSDVYAGKFLDRLDQLERPTVVFISSDHGESLGEHGIPYHNLNFYKPIVHVPMIVYYRGIKPGHIASAVSLLDFYPTVRALMGDAPNPALGGRSLLPYVVEGIEDKERAVFHEAQFIQYKLYYSKRGMTKGKYRFFWDVLTDGEELYDISSDPKEKVNLVSALPGAAESLRQEIYQHMESVAIKMPLTDFCSYWPTDEKKKRPNPRYVESQTVSELPAGFEARNVVFDDKIKLEGYRINTRTLGRNNSSVTVELAVKALKPLKNDYEIFVHTKGKNGNHFNKNLDHVPMRGYLPTSKWEKNRTYLDVFSFDTAGSENTGLIEIAIGFHSKGKRLKVSDKSGDSASLSSNQYKLVEIPFVSE